MGKFRFELFLYYDQLIRLNSSFLAYSVSKQDDVTEQEKICVLFDLSSFLFFKRT